MLPVMNCGPPPEQREERECSADIVHAVGCQTVATMGWHCLDFGVRG